MIRSSCRRSRSFAVLVIPVPSVERTTTALTWPCLLEVSRVNAQVKKRVLLCFVHLPPTAQAQAARDPGSWMAAVRVSCLSLDRWQPHRM